MIKKIQHIGIAVKNLDLSEKIFSDLFGRDFINRELVEKENVEVSFLNLGESKLELLQSTNETSAIARFITKKGEGINHICIEVTEIENEISRLSNLGFQFISKNPTIGAGNKKIVFIHPKSTNGVLIELCENISNGF